MEKKTETTSEYLEITAAQGDGGKHKVVGLAYGGGKMRLFGWSKPVVVDLSGMTVPESVPLLAKHARSSRRGERQGRERTPRHRGRHRGRR